MWRGTLLLTVVLLAACGGSGDDDARLSREELVERADQICARHFSAITRHEQGIDPTDEEVSPPGRVDLGDFARVFPRIADEFRDLALDLSELQPPAELDARYRETLRQIEDVAEILDRAGEAARNDDRQAMNAALQQSSVGPEIQRFFAENGFEDCRATGGSAGG